MISLGSETQQPAPPRPVTIRFSRGLPIRPVPPGIYTVTAFGTGYEYAYLLDIWSGLIAARPRPRDIFYCRGGELGFMPGQGSSGPLPGARDLVVELELVGAAPPACFIDYEGSRA